MDKNQQNFKEAQEKACRAQAEFQANRALAIKKVKETYGKDAAVTEEALAKVGYDLKAEQNKFGKALTELKNAQGKVNSAKPMSKDTMNKIWQEVASQKGVTVDEMKTATYPLPKNNSSTNEDKPKPLDKPSPPSPSDKPQPSPKADDKKDSQKKNDKKSDKKDASKKTDESKDKNPIGDTTAGGKTALGYGNNLKTTSIFSETNVSFSGHDMVVVFEIPVDGGASISEVIGSLQTITYSIHQEKAPVRGIGDMNAKGYVFGPRTIAGSMIFTVFNKHWAKSIMDKYQKALKKTAHYLADELPPFNVTISCANEYGNRAHLALFGVTFVNEGQIMSINDNYTENTFEFFATDVDYLDDIARNHEPLTPNSNNNGSIKQNNSNTTPAAPKPVKDPKDAKGNGDGKDPQKKNKDEYKLLDKDPSLKLDPARLGKMSPKASTVLIDETIKNLNKELDSLKASSSKLKDGTKEKADYDKKIRDTRNSLKMAKDLKKQSGAKLGLINGEIQLDKGDENK